MPSAIVAPDLVGGRRSVQVNGLQKLGARLRLVRLNSTKLAANNIEYRRGSQPENFWRSPSNWVLGETVVSYFLIVKGNWRMYQRRKAN